MHTVADIAAFAETRSGCSLAADEGVRHGVPDRDVHGLTLCWMATPAAIRAAGEAGHELIIAHETLYFSPFETSPADADPAASPQCPVNRQRRELLDHYGLSLLRLHGSADRICILDAFAARLGLGAPVCNDGFIKTYDIPECSLADLIETVKRRLGIGAVRVTAGWDETRLVHRIGLPWGGMGLFVNIGYQRQLVQQGCDAFVAGESDSYGFQFAAEAGIPMIETSHEGSENPGLARFAVMLRDAFPEIAVQFHQNPVAWTWR